MNRPVLNRWDASVKKMQLCYQQRKLKSVCLPISSNRFFNILRFTEQNWACFKKLYNKNTSLLYSAFLSLKTIKVMEQIDETKRKPRRTLGTPSYYYRNRFAASVILAGCGLFGLWA